MEVSFAVIKVDNRIIVSMRQSTKLARRRKKCIAMICNVKKSSSYPSHFWPKMRYEKEIPAQIKNLFSHKRWWIILNVMNDSSAVID
jgi:hypothetical protein